MLHPKPVFKLLLNFGSVSVSRTFEGSEFGIVSTPGDAVFNIGTTAASGQLLRSMVRPSRHLSASSVVRMEIAPNTEHISAVECIGV